MLKEETIKMMQHQQKLEYKFEGIDKEILVYELLDNIGHPDGEIRDGLIYPCLAHLLHDKHFNEEFLTSIFERLLDDEHLFYKIKENPLNSVLTRSFTSLQVVIVLLVHKRDSIISQSTIKNALSRYLEYFKEETHFEGYNENVGWLHSIAHAADVFNQFLSLDYFLEEELKLIFEAILIKMKQRKHNFSFNEDERMVVGITKAIKRNVLCKEYLLNWIDMFSVYEKNGNFPEMYFITKNVKDILRSLYFSLVDNKDYSYLTERILKVLKENVTHR